jgi:hypothetical protein
LRRLQLSAIPCTVGTRRSAARCNGTVRQVAGVCDGKEMPSQVFGGADDDWDPSALDDPAAPTLSVTGLAERNKKRAKALPAPPGVCGGVTFARARSTTVPPCSPLARDPTCC